MNLPANRPLRIVIPAETYAPEVNGAARFAQRLAEGLASRGHDVHVFAPSATGVPSHEDLGGVSVHRLISHRWLMHPSWMIALPWQVKPVINELLDDIRPDVVHSQAHFVIGRYGISEAAKRGLPVVATNHFMPDNVRPYVSGPEKVLDVGATMAWWDLRRCVNRADVLTVPTQLAADLLTQNGIDMPIRAISCGIDLSRFRPSEVGAAARHDGPPTVVFVGRLAQEKHVDHIIRALAASDPALDIHATIVGTGEQREPLWLLADSLGVADRVEFTGQISDQDLEAAYARSTFFCMPSTAELQSIATLEAMGSGLPVALANAVALPHLVRDGFNGRIFEPGDVDELAGIFNDLAGADDAEYQRLSKGSIAMAQRHDINSTISAFEQIYYDVVARKQAANAA